MLPRAHRMVDPEDFATTIRHGSRAGNAMVVVHCRTDEDSPSLVGFVVPKRALAHATARNRVKRQLRHLMRSRVEDLPAGTHIVIRVQREAHGVDHTTLGNALDNALGRALRKEARP